MENTMLSTTDAPRPSLGSFESGASLWDGQFGASDLAMPGSTEEETFRRIFPQMGAVLGNSQADDLRRICNTVPLRQLVPDSHQMEFGDAERTLEKWERLVPVPKVPENSLRDFFEWAMELSRHVKVWGMPLSVLLLRVDRNRTSRTARPIRDLITIQNRITNFRTFSFGLARQLYPLDTLGETLEREFILPTPRDTVVDADSALFEALELYALTCECYLVASMVTPTILKRFYLGLLPRTIREAILRELPFDARFYQVQARAREVQFRLGFERVTGAVSAAIAGPSYACHACGQTGHFRLACPHKNAQCANCERRGHLASVCRQKALRDASGRERVTITSGARGNVQIQTHSDATARDQALTLQHIGGAQVTHHDQLNQRRSRRRIELLDQREGSGTAPAEDSPPPDVAMSIYPAQGQKGVWLTAFQINGVPIEVGLDTMASECIISSQDALRCELRTDPDRPPRRIVVANGAVETLPETFPDNPAGRTGTPPTYDPVLRHAGEHAPSHLVLGYPDARTVSVFQFHPVGSASSTP